MDFTKDLRNHVDPTPAGGTDNSSSEENQVSLSNKEDPSEFPDGGRPAWSVVLGSWCALLPSFGIMNISGILEAWLADNQLRDYSKASISWTFSLSLFLFYIGGVQAGPIFDSYAYYQFILGFSILGGLSTSLILSPALGTINHWFYERRGSPTGVATTAGGFGGIIFTNVFGVLSAQIRSPWAIRILRFIFFCCFIISMLFIKTRLPPNIPGGNMVDLHSLGEANFTMTSIAVAAAEVGLMVVITYLPSYAKSHGVPDPLSYQLMCIFSVASIPGRVIPGLIADRLGRFNAMIVTAAVCTVLILALWLNAYESEAAILGFAAFFGFWAGPAIALSPVCVAQISRTEDYGKRYGTTTTFLSICLLVTLPQAGEIQKAQNPSSQDESIGG
ncbi:hypothetical protein BBP40_008762 [Aspergillus hancockii]|nr:hypothetical protein BBP40_008762 [Aspergillus hancockii]